MEIKDKAAVITGGASGIGLGIAQALVEKGARVMLADIEHDEAEQAARELGAKAKSARVDVRHIESVEALAEKAWEEFGQVDMVFNNAGVGSSAAPLIDLDPEEAYWVIQVNLQGVWHGISVFGKRFVAQNQPAVICSTGSEHSLGFVHPLQGIYTATKHAVLGMSDVLRHELPGFIKVSVVCPGIVRSNIANAGRNGPKGPLPEEQLEMRERFFAMGVAPLEIGRQVAAGIEREDFIIATHAHAVKFAEGRWKEISAAFAAQAPYTPESEEYNVNTIMQKMTGPS